MIQLILGSFVNRRDSLDAHLSKVIRNVSPLLASRSGLDTIEDSMAVVAAKIAELVAL
ncbi:hypothetical protein [Pseudomonas sp.]|uniref:hypothetical protein n=1 Tax=Pseudomonas sp. TaxID=306 RepID=UPI00286B380B|nr:hypothetical protein [Pseudomonas sp.]